jgi:type VI secretion system protein ImpF
MNTNKRKLSVAPSLLDRLLDDAPHKQQEDAKPAHQQLADLRLSVRRDLENLLNTRRSEITWPALWQQLDCSLLAYGVSDITGRALDTVPLQHRLCQELARVIETFEPRLRQVKVELFATDQRADRVLRLRIQAWLQMNPAPEPVVFDSLLKPEIGSFHVVEGEE